MSEVKLITMTDGELEEFAERIATKTAIKVASASPIKEQPAIGYGLDALAEAIGLSRTKASQLKQTGIFDAAINGSERKFQVDMHLARQLFFDYKRKVKKGIIK